MRSLAKTKDRWMDEQCFRPLFCTIKAELGRGQPGSKTKEPVVIIKCHTVFPQMSGPGAHNFNNWCAPALKRDSFRKAVDHNVFF